ncbi:MAG: ligase-associated DNA damage response endonuclease PdeM [Bacteroidota bacterium]
MLFHFHQQHFHLHAYKAIYWQEQKALLIADLHLGKVKHFRKSGFAVPSSASNENWDKLIALLLEFKPKQVLFLGDLFHSEYNDIWEELGKLIRQFSAIKFILVKGNHDILSEENYEVVDLEVCEELLLPPFLLTHHPQEANDLPHYNLAGHIHPSVRLKGDGKQYLRLPCFYFGLRQGILPAFGSFTGTATIQPKKQDRVFVIVEEEVIEVSG